ncbi:hypothetical protein R6Q57_020417 [Mikania cordata]
MKKRRSCTVKNLPASVLDAATKQRPLIARINGGFALFLNIRIYLHIHRHLIATHHNYGARYESAIIISTNCS